jgi:L-methionine (R)-S-oxide reductase
MEQSLVKSVETELNGNGNALAKMLNALAMVKEALGENAWVGLYVYQESDNVLNLGPFQGSPACETIKPGKGVVGTSYAAKRPMYVPDVSKFPGYISCDARVQSEAVFPIVYQDAVIAIFDVDSPKLDGLKNDLDVLGQVAQLFGNFSPAN